MSSYKKKHKIVICNNLPDSSDSLSLIFPPIKSVTGGSVFFCYFSDSMCERVGRASHATSGHCFGDVGFRNQRHVALHYGRGNHVGNYGGKQTNKKTQPSLSRKLVRSPKPGTGVWERCSLSTVWLRTVYALLCRAAFPLRDLFPL